MINFRFFLKNVATVVACFAVCFMLFGCDKEVEDGKDGADGTPGSVVTIGANGNWFIDGDDTGVSARGSVVTIGDNGNWFIDGEDTGVSARGSVVTIGDNGNWFIDGEDTGVSVLGEQDIKIPVTLVTNAATDITLTMAILGGIITFAGAPEYTERGVCFATTVNPTIESNRVEIEGTGVGKFRIEISGLTAYTVYYTRAYAISALGTFYGEQVSFTTEDENTNASGVWTQKADFAGGHRGGAVGFSVGNKGYVGSGLNWVTNNNFHDFWEYDPVTDVWTQKANIPDDNRSHAIGFSIGEKGYVGTGSYGGSGRRHDFWEYDPVLNNWTQKANIAVGRVLAVGFSVGDKGYVGTGVFLLQDFWEYDPISDSWTQKANFTGGTREYAVGFSIGNKGYVGTGRGFDPEGYYNGSFQDFWEYDPVSNSWTQKANFAGEGRLGAVGFSIGNKGYIGTGGKEDCEDCGDFQDFWEYDPISNNWTQKANYAGGNIFRPIGFSIGNKGYVGTGWDTDSNRKDFWEFTP